MIHSAALLSDLKKRVDAIEIDLNQQLQRLPEVRARLGQEWTQARGLRRTAATVSAWLDERITQVAVAWVLGTIPVT
ncbi:hypothetical protein [Nocardia sp. BMG111209]|uniref:hypothetical protein n=1 Tax=Nocardia sp. BMG111209 TaxID=1160137 RepID=UPI00047810E5|nr:hypothetical protein [Nocardia sp. BMG111209]